MTIVKCKECGKKVSNTAAACPSCGAPSFIPEKNKPSKIVKYGGGFVVLTILTSVFIGMFSDARKSSGSERHLTQARAVADSIKMLARDPESVKVEKLLISDDGKISCTQYQAKNGFGGTNRETLVMFDGQASRSIADWVTYCRDTFRDYASSVW